MKRLDAFIKSICNHCYNKKRIKMLFGGKSHHKFRKLK